MLYEIVCIDKVAIFFFFVEFAKSISSVMHFVYVLQHGEMITIFIRFELSHKF